MLPDFKQKEIQYHHIEIPQKAVTIRVRDFDVGDVKDYLKRLGDDIKTNESAAFDLIYSCTHPDDINILSNLESYSIIYIILYLRRSTISENYNYPHKCPHCEGIYPSYQVVNYFDKLHLSYSNRNAIEFEIDSKKIILNMKHISFKDAIAENEMTEDKMIYYSIHSIVIEQNENVDLYEFENISFEEFNIRMESNLNVNQYLTLLNYIRDDKNKNYINIIDKKDSCAYCGKSYDIIISDYNFFIMA